MMWILTYLDSLNKQYLAVEKESKDAISPVRHSEIKPDS